VTPGVSVKFTLPYPRSAATLEFPSVTEEILFALPICSLESASSECVASTWSTEADTLSPVVLFTADAISARTWSLVSPSVSVTVTCVPLIENVFAPAPSDVISDVSVPVNCVESSRSDFARRVTLSIVCEPIDAFPFAVPSATVDCELVTVYEANDEEEPVAASAFALV
jgi:hypothetical protein